MNELDQLRAEVSELRQAVLHLAHIENQKRVHFFMVPRGPEMRPDQTFYNLVRLCTALGTIPENTPNIQGAPWLTALEKRDGITFDGFRKDFRAVVDLEGKQRAARRKAA